MYPLLADSAIRHVVCPFGAVHAPRGVIIRQIHFDRECPLLAGVFSAAIGLSCML